MAYNPAAHALIGGRIARLYRGATPQFWDRMGTGEPTGAKKTSNYKGNMVEAGGIEPPSENRRAVATTRLFRDLISPQQRPRTGCAAASHFAFRVRAQVADGVSLAH